MFGLIDATSNEGRADCENTGRTKIRTNNAFAILIRKGYRLTVAQGKHSLPDMVHAALASLASPFSPS
ncbi:MAG: hypothetical protein DMG14_27520 [Acidobacteria bacterium]|nr:MAG: hypothetical protein DMG14_27520 [Acidobacteriota bacterium]